MKSTRWFVAAIVAILIGSTAIPAYAYEVEDPIMGGYAVRQTSAGTAFTANQRSVIATYGLTRLPQPSPTAKAALLPMHLAYVQESMAASARANKPAKPSFITYTVKKGDTLYHIGRLFDLSAETLMLENRITDPTKLQIGQVLRIPTVAATVPDWLDEQADIEKVLTATLTAYTAGVESTGKTPSHPAYGITASGTKVKEGRTIAVDPSVIPYGSTVYIEGVGIRTAEDTGSAIKGPRIDVFMTDVKKALKFGVKKNVKVYVLSNS